MLDAYRGDRRACEMIVKMAGENANETPVHTVLLLYKARALRGLGLHTAARETLTVALRRSKDRSVELLRAVRYPPAGTTAMASISTPPIAETRSTGLRAVVS